MTTSTEIEVAPLSGAQKAAVLLVQVGQENAAKVLSHMRPAEIEELTAEILRLRSVSPEIAGVVLEEFHSMIAAPLRGGAGGMDFAQALLEGALGADGAAEVLGRVAESQVVQPFQFLHQADPQQILTFLTGEHPQTIALVVAHLRPDQASMILGGLSPEMQADIAYRIATMEATSTEYVRLIEDVVQRRTSTVLQAKQNTAVGGVQPLVEIINRADRGTERSILEGLTAKDAPLAEEIRALMFVFEDITTLDDRAIQLVLRGVETADLATALKGVKDSVRDKILRNVSERARENLLDEIEMLGPVRMSAVEESQQKVVQVIRQLEESGQIVLTRGGDDDFVA
ncbi:flagellar motor switch protein FliG [Paenibacillus sp. TRM 82003]|uniref:flagellar motor switch protein FliG n=1 Tax=Kineococcus sp. TRM81007 TaxID=2925831 RepID=UPI001F5A97FA|nr:flagellar motor switch protein FliG [Kineococcus sp. TRM81007]MCI2240611.1 flagellar motor switch protein FliG [Kineococcus sp. TRM81007]MCI3925467.1 flagellar motor switch protein FliG [Paenibacillus sp. TRM 82003]